MPPRDEQDYEVRRQQIIDGALAAFASHGFERATNKQIAEAAGIGSPGLIYHYFRDKSDLLYQVIAERMPLIAVIASVEQLHDEPPEVVLPRLAASLSRALEQPVTLAIGKIVLGEALRHPQVARTLSEIGPGRALSALASYLARQMDLGRLRRGDPQIAARALIGPLMAYFLSREILAQPEARAIPPQAMADEAVALFLRGMAP